jgi:polyisoprenoid-binding protein YceI
MHEEVLESARFPEIAFRPERIDVKTLAPPRAELTLLGRIEIHGTSHPLAIPADVVATAPDRLHVRARFSIPYASWGMKDVGNLLLRVDDAVLVEIDAEGVLAEGSR